MIFLAKKGSDKDNNLQMKKSKNIPENKMKCNVVDDLSDESKRSISIILNLILQQYFLFYNIL